MTFYVTYKIAQKLNISLDEVYFTVSEQAAHTGGTSSNLEAGDKLLINDLLYGIMLASGNDAALTLAENLGVLLFLHQNGKLEEGKIFLEGSNNKEFKNSYESLNPISYFVKEMNNEAKKLGLTKTFYSNAHGLNNKFNKSTAHDVCKLAIHCLKIEEFALIVSTPNYCCQAYTITNEIKEFY